MSHECQKYNVNITSKMQSLKLLNSLNKRIFQQVSLCSSKRLYSGQVHSKQVLRQPSKRPKIGPVGWFLLVVPASTFALGTWQVQRKKWKENLLADLQSLTTADPIPLPADLNELEMLEYRPVLVRGRFLHDKELHMGPRTLILKGDASTKSELMSTGSNKSQGYLVVTPFQLADRNEIILVNRGWVPADKKHPARRLRGQPQEDLELVGVVRLQENRPTFMPKNQEDSNQWFYRDLKQMAQTCGAVPVMLDVINECDIPGGPIGGQTRITLRNEHLSYVLTWYSLCAATSFMWYSKFLKK